MGGKFEKTFQAWGEVLKKESLRRNDALFILQSGKAVIILLGTPREEAKVIATRVVETTKTLFSKGENGELRLDFQLLPAIAAVPEDGKSVAELMKFILDGSAGEIKNDPPLLRAGNP